MQTAMIWGASGGIGRALVSLLQSEGWSVLAVVRDASDIGDVGDLAEHVIEADVSKPFDVERAVMSAAQSVDEVALWVYAVGDISAAKTGDADEAMWQRVLDANLTGAFLTAHHSLPLLAEDAHLFFIGAYSERLRLPGLGAYAAAKAGLEAFTATLGKEERKRKVTNVRPGAVDTPFWEKVPLRLPKDAMSAEEVAKRILAAFEDGVSGSLDL